MHIALWVVQGLLAAAFLFAGLAKVTQPREKLKATMNWVDDFSDAAVRAIGAIEIAAAAGLVLPPLLGIATVLTPLAATGLVVLMVGAALTHVRRGESQPVVVNIVLLALAAFVAWGRFGPEAF